MAKRKKGSELNNVLGLLLGYANVLDITFKRLTGKPIKEWLEEFRQAPRELPPGAPLAATEPEMSLDNACMVLGVKEDDPLEKIKHNYRALARVYHSDKGAMNDEAMKLINRAYERIMKEKK